MAESTIPRLLPAAPAAMQHCIQHGPLTWLDFSYPGAEQVAYLREHYRFHPLHLEDILSRVQRPKLDDDDEAGYAFLVLHFPIFNEMTRLSTVSEVDIFVGQDFVITLHDGKLRPLRQLVNVAEGSGRAQLMGHGAGFLLYRVIQALVDSWPRCRSFPTCGATLSACAASCARTSWCCARSPTASAGSCASTRRPTTAIWWTA
jgi:magnesium transporter